MTAHDLYKALEVLSRIEASSLEQLKDPTFVGCIKAEAFLASLPLRAVFSKIDVQISEKKCCAASQC